MEENKIKNIIFSCALSLMLGILALALTFLTSCQYLPQMMDNIEKIADNDAIIIKCDKDAFQRQTDVKITVDVINKDK